LSLDFKLRYRNKYSKIKSFKWANF